MRAGGVTGLGLAWLLAAPAWVACSFEPAPPVVGDGPTAIDARVVPDGRPDAVPPAACLGPVPERAHLCLQFDDPLSDQVATDGGPHGLDAQLMSIAVTTRDAPTGTSSPAAAVQPGGTIRVDEDPGLDVTDTFTLLAWARHTRGPTSPAIAFGIVSNPGQYELRLGYNNRPTCQAMIGSLIVPVVQGQPLAPNAWYLLACTYDGAELCVHSNWAGGSLQTCMPASGPVSTSGTAGLIAGTSGPASSVFAGALDAVHLFDVALDRADLCALAGRPGC